MSKAIIVDANSFNKGLSAELKKAIRNRVVKIVLPMDGKLYQEIRQSNLIRFREYAKDGTFYFVCKKQVQETIDRLIPAKCIKCRSSCNCIKSDDEHVIAVAVVSGANVIVTNDDALWDDFQRCDKLHLNFGGIKGHKVASSGDRKRIHTKSGDPSVKLVRQVLRKAYVKYGVGDCKGNVASCENQSILNR